MAVRLTQSQTIALDDIQDDRRWGPRAQYILSNGTDLRVTVAVYGSPGGTQKAYFIIRKDGTTTEYEGATPWQKHVRSL